MAHWRDEQEKKELLEGKLGSYMGDSGARRYHKK
jgi:hypothetical protein